MAKVLCKRLQTLVKPLEKNELGRVTLLAEDANDLRDADDRQANR
jgi:hypothetical protein